VDRSPDFLLPALRHFLIHFWLAWFVAEPYDWLMKTTDWRVAVQGQLQIQPTSLLIAAIVMIATASTYGDGFFVFRWNKEKDISEPTQKAIILHEQGREDLILQVKYEGPAKSVRMCRVKPRTGNA
jgi:hypothetical protein